MPTQAKILRLLRTPANRFGSRAGRPLGKDSPSGPPRAVEHPPETRHRLHPQLFRYARSRIGRRWAGIPPRLVRPGLAARSSRQLRWASSPSGGNPRFDARAARLLLSVSSHRGSRFDRARPSGALLGGAASARCRRTCRRLREPLPRLPRLPRLALRLPPLDPVVDRCKTGFPRGLRARPNRIEVHIDAARQHGRLVQKPLALVAAFETGRCSHPPGSRAGDRLGQAPHQPGDARQPAALSSTSGSALSRASSCSSGSAGRSPSCGPPPPGDFVVRTSRGRCRAIPQNHVKVVTRTEYPRTSIANWPARNSNRLRIRKLCGNARSPCRERRPARKASPGVRSAGRNGKCAPLTDR